MTLLLPHSLLFSSCCRVVSLSTSWSNMHDFLEPQQLKSIGILPKFALRGVYVMSLRRVNSIRNIFSLTFTQLLARLSQMLSLFISYSLTLRIRLVVVVSHKLIHFICFFVNNFMVYCLPISKATMTTNKSSIMN